MFFCYSALESTAMLWASSYMALGKGIDKTTAAMWGSLFCIGITVGRLASGFLTMKLNDPAMIRLGQALVLTGIVIMLLPLPHNIGTIAGLMVIGLGCAPIYPCVIHSTPAYFGEDKSQAIVACRCLRLCGIDVHAAAVRADRATCFGQPVPVLSGGVPGADGRHA